MLRIQDAVLVVAHPDDEILWFSSILGHCKSVLVCFGPSATSTQSWDGGRARLMEAYPLSKVRFLKVRESEAFGAADWRHPVEVASGLQLRTGRASLYEQNAEELLSLLEVELNQASVVVTHNPWGEYGHEEHVQVFRTLMRLRAKLGFDIWVNSYVSDRTVELMWRYENRLDGIPVTRETDRELAHDLKKLYLENDCWTWMSDYRWPRYECFYRVIDNTQGIEAGTRAGLPLNCIDHNFNQGPLRRIASRMTPASAKSLIKRAYGLRRRRRMTTLERLGAGDASTPAIDTKVGGEK